MAADDSSLLPLDERRILKILESLCTKTEDRYSVGPLWNEDNPKLPDNWNPAASRVKI